MVGTASYLWSLVCSWVDGQLIPRANVETGAWREEPMGSVFLTFLGCWHSKRYLHHYVFYVGLCKGGVELLGAAMVSVSEWRLIIMPFSAQSTWHREKLHEHKQCVGEGESRIMRLQITPSNFTVDESSSICKYEMQCKLFTVLFLFVF